MAREGTFCKSNKTSMPYDPITLQYGEGKDGQCLRYSDESLRYRAAMRAVSSRARVTRVASTASSAFSVATSLSRLCSGAFTKLTFKKLSESGAAAADQEDDIALAQFRAQPGIADPGSKAKLCLQKRRF